MLFTMKELLQAQEEMKDLGDKVFARIADPSIEEWIECKNREQRFIQQVTTDSR